MSQKAIGIDQRLGPAISAPTFLDYAEVVRCAPLPLVITAMRKAFQNVEAPPRTSWQIPLNGARPASLLVMPSWRPGERIGVKVVNVFPDNGALGLPAVNAQYLVFSGHTGQFEAALDGRALTALRTSALSAVAADLLSPPDARRLLLVGTGELAPFLGRAHAIVRPVSIKVWGRNPEKAKSVAEALAGEGIDATPASDLESEARRADIISCATLSQQALILGDWLKPGAHLDLVGGFRPDMREVDDEAVRRSTVVIDTLAALDESGDMCEPIREGILDVGRIRTLAQVLNGANSFSNFPNTIFKSVGTAECDLAAAELALHRALTARAPQG